MICYFGLPRYIAVYHGISQYYGHPNHAKNQRLNIFGKSK